MEAGIDLTGRLNRRKSLEVVLIEMLMVELPKVLWKLLSVLLPAFVFQTIVLLSMQVPDVHRTATTA